MSFDRMSSIVRLSKKRAQYLQAFAIELIRTIILLHVQGNNNGSELLPTLCQFVNPKNGTVHCKTCLYKAVTSIWFQGGVRDCFPNYSGTAFRRCRVTLRCAALSEPTLFPGSEKRGPGLSHRSLQSLPAERGLGRRESTLLLHLPRQDPTQDSRSWRIGIVSGKLDLS